jgi:uncharacterized protein with PIN domain
MFAVTISAIAHMVSNENRGNMAHNRCPRCSSDLVTTRGRGRVAIFEGVTVAVPRTMQLVRCHGCGTAYPTPEQAQGLRAAALAR